MTSLPANSITTPASATTAMEATATAGAPAAAGAATGLSVDQALRPVAVGQAAVADVAGLADVAVVRPRRRRGPINWLVVAGAAILTIVLGLTVAAPVLAPYNPAEQRARERLQGPSQAHPMGTDRLGRDIYSRVLYGGRTSLAASTASLAITVTIGVALGLLAGYAGGWTDAAIMRLVDVLLAFPSFILALIVAGLYGPGLLKVVLAATAVWWVSYARVTRSMVLQAKQEPYVLAARAAGAPPLTIALREVLPQIMGPILVLAMINLGRLLLTLSGLSFLGMGAQPPTAEWGLMLSEGKAYFLEMPHMMVFPGAMIFVTVLGLTLLGEGLRDVLDPNGAAGKG
jgi:peptide/nickel transport system permease protein